MGIWLWRKSYMKLHTRASRKTRLQNLESRLHGLEPAAVGRAPQPLETGLPLRHDSCNRCGRGGADMPTEMRRSTMTRRLVACLLAGLLMTPAFGRAASRHGSTARISTKLHGGTSKRKVIVGLMLAGAAVAGIVVAARHYEGGGSATRSVYIPSNWPPRFNLPPLPPAPPQFPPPTSPPSPFPPTPIPSPPRPPSPFPRP